MMARALALNGAHKVYIIGRRKEVLEKAAASVSTNNIIPLVGDVTSKDAINSIVSTITSEVGYINLLVANSGMLGPQAAIPIPDSPSVSDFQKAWFGTPVEEYTQTFNLNTTAVWYTIVAFLGLLDEGNKKGNMQQKSQVIATSSIGGFNRYLCTGLLLRVRQPPVCHRTDRFIQKCPRRFCLWPEQGRYDSPHEAVGNPVGSLWDSCECYLSWP
jgi:NAD(P)-dependent dehydrogenase (short-subunit alcohol dehydrogenase family)